MELKELENFLKSHGFYITHFKGLANGMDINIRLYESKDINPTNVKLPIPKESPIWNTPEKRIERLDNSIKELQNIRESLTNSK